MRKKHSKLTLYIKHDTIYRDFFETKKQKNLEVSIPPKEFEEVKKVKTTEELIARISPRYKELRNQNADFLWEDFLQAVEKATGKIPDEMFAATSGVSITYFTKEGDENIYRSKTAECHHFQDKTVEYEEDDVCLGKKEMLAIAFKDFKARAKADKHITTEWFELEDLKLDDDVEASISLDFWFPKEL